MTTISSFMSTACTFAVFPVSLRASMLLMVGLLAFGGTAFALP
jgi:hypothetical protein